MQNELCDLFAPGAQSVCGWPLRDALARVAEEGSGVVVILRHTQSADELLEQIRHCNQPYNGATKSTAGDHELRTLGVGSQILADVGVRSMRILGAPKVMHGLSGFGLTVTEYIEG